MLPPFIYTLGAYVGAYAEKLKARKPLILRAFLMPQTGIEPVRGLNPAGF